MNPLPSTRDCGICARANADVAVNETHETQAEPVKSSDFAEFGQFAAHVGAHSLEAQLEAQQHLSKLWIDQFSRPQLLRRETQRTEDDFSAKKAFSTLHICCAREACPQEDGCSKLPMRQAIE